MVARGFACWRHTSAAACAAETNSRCSWLGGGGGGEDPAAQLWGGLGRPCAMDEAAQRQAVQDFYVSAGR
jgi:hypothetical protein